MKSSDTRLIRLIALFKLLKAALLIAIGAGALKLLHRDLASLLEHWIAMLGLHPGGRFLETFLQKAANLTPHQIRSFGIISFIYAGLFLTEGIGLWLLKRWAEWLTVIITSSLVPLEIYEIVRRPTAVRIPLLLINIALAAYLLYRLRHDRYS
jgi:uncharacterized membrane protein (DUF2068 family)